MKAWIGIGIALVLVWLFLRYGTSLKGAVKSSPTDIDAMPANVTA